MIEIKVPGLKVHEAVKMGEVPPYYFSQTQYNMMVAKINRCIFASYQPETGDLQVVEVTPDADYIEHMMDAVDHFWLEYVQKDVAPPLSKGDYVDKSGDMAYADLASRWHILRDEIEERAAQKLEVEANLKKYVHDVPGVRGHGVSVSAHERKGSIDYKAVKELRDVDLEPYRKPTKRVETVRAVKL